VLEWIKNERKMYNGLGEDLEGSVLGLKQGKQDLQFNNQPQVLRLGFDVRICLGF